MWTYVQGLIKLGAPGRTQAEKDYIFANGNQSSSKGDMDIHIVRAYGHNMWSNRDEFHNLARGFKTQSRYFLVLDGHLRDRRYEETFKELNKFLNRLAKRLNVHLVYVRLNDYDRYYTFTNKNDCYENMFDDEHPWYKYLMWEFEDED